MGLNPFIFNPSKFFPDTVVTSKLLTGFISGAGVVAATDTILQAIQKLNGNTAALTGAIIYQGVWDASANSPALASGVGIKGYLYKVSVTGTTSIDGINQWNAGDAIVYNGAAWNKIDGLANEVVTVAGRTGNVVLASGDVSGLAASATTDTTTTANITDSSNKRFCTDAQKTVLGNTSGTNTGDQTNISGNAATVTTNANLTGVVTSVGNATSIANSAITNAMLANAAVANLSGTNTGNQTITLTGDVTGSGTGSFAATLANSGVTATTYGDASHIPQLAIDAKGRITLASNIAFSAGASSFSGLSGTLGATQIQSGTFAAKPSASGNAGLHYFATDLGTAGIVIISDGTKWKPISGIGNIASTGTANVTTAASETNLAAIKIPAGLLSANGMLRISVWWVMSTTATNSEPIIRHNTTSGAITGGDKILDYTPTSDSQAYTQSIIINANSASVQAASGQAGTANIPNVGTSASYNAGAINTANDSYININDFVNSGGGNAGYKGYLVEWIEG